MSSAHYLAAMLGRDKKIAVWLWPFVGKQTISPALPKPLFLALLWEGVKEGWCWVFCVWAEGRNYHISGWTGVSPLVWIESTALCWPIVVRGFHLHRLSVLHSTPEFTSLKDLMSLKVKSSHNSIDLLLILEQCYNNDYNGWWHGCFSPF